MAAVLSYCYVGGLISALMASTFERPPDSWRDLLDENYAIKSLTNRRTGQNPFGSIVHFRRAEKGSVFNEIYKRINEPDDFRDFYSEHFSSKIDADDYKSYLSNTRGLAVIWYSSENRFYSYMFNSSGDRVLHAGNENSFATFYTMNLRRRFVYNELWARECRLYWEMGLPYKWQNIENAKYKVVSQQQLDGPPKIAASLPEKIRIEHIYGPLIFLLAGLSSALLTFIGVECALNQ